jgi:D-galactarolactone cycloisomerase
VLEEERVFWYEEPFEPDDLDRYLALRERVSIPLAAGENEFGSSGFHELLRAGAVDIIQPDACRAGGITECVRAGRLAQEYGAGVATHTWSDAVALIANAHVIAALPNGITVEVDRTGNPFIDELLVEPISVVDGLLTLPEGPGLGIELDERPIARLRVPDDAPVAEGNYSDMVFGRQHLGSSPPYRESAQEPNP